MSDHTYTTTNRSHLPLPNLPKPPNLAALAYFLLDTSGSMQGDSIDELNRGLQAFREELFNDSLSMKRVEMAIVTFGPVRVMQDFTTADQFQPSPLEASGDTPLAAVGRWLDAAPNNGKKFCAQTE